MAKEEERVLRSRASVHARVPARACASQPRWPPYRTEHVDGWWEVLQAAGFRKRKVAAASPGEGIGEQLQTGKGPATGQLHAEG